MKSLRISLMFAFFFSMSTAVINNLVVTRLGRIKGKTVFYNGMPVRAYLGIPYAKHPTGNLRFRRPVPVEPWCSTLEATKISPGCVQYSSTPLPTADTQPGLTTNCLKLNIWTPVDKSAHRKKTVMFWIHGGGFRISSARLKIFEGRVLAALGDVIVVTFDFRLGAEGFFYSGTEDAPGNVGMWDMVEALKWVRCNIHSFGGDKNSITLFGQSSGAISIGMFVTSPITRGLFKRIIMQSGTPANLDVTDNNNNLDISRSLAEHFGCAVNDCTFNRDPRGVVECMREKDPFEIAVVLANVTSSRARGYYPQYGDDLFPTNPYEAIRNGDFVPVNLFIGSDSGDGSPLLTTAKESVFGIFGQKNAQVNYSFGESILSEKFKMYPDPNAVVTQYLGDVDHNDYYKIREQVFMAYGDYSRVCPSNYFAESFAKKNVPVYYYYFTHISSNTPWAPWMLAVHTEEIPFVFGFPLRYPKNYSLAELNLSRRMLHTWSNFAKTGKPSLGNWPLYSRENPVYEVLNINTFGTGRGPNKNNCDFFRWYFGF